jgi:hypothetical protein
MGTRVRDKEEDVEVVGTDMLADPVPVLRPVLRTGEEEDGVCISSDGTWAMGSTNIGLNLRGNPRMVVDDQQSPHVQ